VKTVRSVLLGMDFAPLDELELLRRESETTSFFLGCLEGDLGSGTGFGTTDRGGSLADGPGGDFGGELGCAKVEVFFSVFSRWLGNRALSPGA
jgi:hypothetical protein